IWGSFLSTTLFFPTEMMVEGADQLVFSSKPYANLTRQHNGESREAKWWRESLESSGNFTRDVSALLAPGGSAIFMLLRAARVPVALEQLRNYGNTIVHTSLSAEHDDEMFTMLAH